MLLCANHTGYTTLNRLLTEAHLRGRDHPEVGLELKDEDNQGLFLLTGGLEGRLYRLVQAGRYAKARD